MSGTNNVSVFPQFIDFKYANLVVIHLDNRFTKSQIANFEIFQKKNIVGLKKGNHVMFYLECCSKVQKCRKICIFM